MADCYGMVLTNFRQHRPSYIHDVLCHERVSIILFILTAGIGKRYYDTLVGYRLASILFHSKQIRLEIIRADSRIVPSQWETLLLCNHVSHWLGVNLESVVIMINITPTIHCHSCVYRVDTAHYYCSHQWWTWLHDITYMSALLVAVL